MTQSRREALRRQQEAQARAKRLQRIILVAAIVLGLVAGVLAVVLRRTLDESDGRIFDSFGGIPIRKCDQITLAEATVA